jgi:type IV pilus assembly protein PilA
MHPRFHRKGQRAFTLIEVMIVVAVVGVLAGLAVFSLRRYMTAAKASEAKQIVGEISRSAHAAYQREQAQSQTVGEGAESVQVSHQLCDTANPVPAGAAPPSKKYQPNTASGFDFQTGDDVTGWRCLKFSVNNPVYHQYLYTRGSSPAAPNAPSACLGGGVSCYEAGSLGDLNGNGLNSRVARTGHVNVATGTLKASTQIFVENESE